MNKIYGETTTWVNSSLKNEEYGNHCKEVSLKDTGENKLQAEKKFANERLNAAELALKRKEGRLIVQESHLQDMEEMSDINDRLSKIETSLDELGEYRQIKAIGNSYNEVHSSLNRFIKSYGAETLSFDSHGGTTISREPVKLLLNQIYAGSELRRVAGSINVSTGRTATIGVDSTNSMPTWGQPLTGAGDKGGRSANINVTLTEMDVPFFQLESHLTIPNGLLMNYSGRDSELMRFIVAGLSRRVAEQENKTFYHGDGISEPLGIFESIFSAKNSTKAEKDKDLNGDHNEQNIVSGNINLIFSKLLEMQSNISSIYKVYKGECFYLMSESLKNKLIGSLRPEGDSRWQHAGGDGYYDRLYGYPVLSSAYIEDDSSVHKVIFGNIKQGFVIVTRQGLTLTKDPFSVHPNLKLSAIIYVGSAMVDRAAMSGIRAQVANS